MNRSNLLKNLITAFATLSFAFSALTPSHAQSWLTNGLVAYYPFNGNAIDASESGNDATPGGNYTFVTNGLSGGALQTVGDNAIYYSGGGHALLPTFSSALNTGFTFSVWTRVQFVGGNPFPEEGIISFGAVGLSYAEILLNNYTVTPYLNFIMNGGGATPNAEIRQNLDSQTLSNSWNHIVMSYIPGKMVGYFNGRKVGETNVTYNIFPVSTAGLARHWWNSGAFSSARMSSLVDNVRIYNRALSSSEVAQLYAIEIASPPAVLAQPTNYIASAGATAIFRATVTGAAPLVSQWWFEGTPVARSTNNLVVANAVFLLPNAQATNAGGYQLITTNPYGAVTSLVATLTITPSSPSITSHPQSRGVALGQSMALGVSARGTEPMFVQWQKDGTDLPGATNLTLPFASFQIEDPGVYRAVVSNSVGTATSQSATLTVTPVFPWGQNTGGQNDVPAGLSNVVVVVAGSDHNLAIRVDGTVAAWGSNSFGQTNAPTSVSNIVAAAAGWYHNLAVGADGTVAAWGMNDYGQINVPANLKNVVGVAGGVRHSLALRADGTVVAWGSSSHGQADVPAGLSNVVAVAAKHVSSLALRSDGTVVAWGKYWIGDAFSPNYVPMIVPPGWSNVVAMDVGISHALALRSDGTVMAWGAGTNNTGSRPNPNYGQSQVPLDLSNVVAVAAGFYHSLALRSDGTVVAWGAGASNTQSFPDYGQSQIPPSLSNVIAMAAGGRHSLAIVGHGFPAPHLWNPVHQPGTFSVSIPTVHRTTYLLEYTDSLSETGWPSAATVQGNGTLRVLSDSNAIGPQRFYRVRQQ